jgi:beta-lactamase class A
MRLTLAFILLTSSTSAQSILQQKIRTISADAKGQVSVACALPNSTLNCDLDPHAHPPMQSVFKLPLVITVLHLVEAGSFTLDQPIRFLPSDRFLPHTHSPLQDQYPDANVDIPLRELLRLAVSQSDNAAADLVLRTIGGPAVVDNYMRSLGIAGFHLEDGERGLARDVSVQFRNWFEPAAAVQLLRRISDDSPLSVAHTTTLLDWMEASPTGPNRIKGLLPSGTAVMHKTGSSDTNGGITYATNDIALITLPDGRRLALAVFVTNSKADEATRERVIARIAKAAFEEARGPQS